MKEKIDLTVMIPFFNESLNIPDLVISLNNYFSKYSNIVTEVIFIDDGSNDDSLNLLKNMNHKNYYCKIISLSKNYGTHSALRAGLKYSSGDYIINLYADLQDPIELINQMYERCKDKFDIVWAVRKSTQLGFFRKIFSKTYAKLMQLFVNPVFPKNGFDIFLINSKIRSELNINVEANSSIFLQILNLGFRQDLIFYDRRERKAGKSKWTISKKFKLLIDSFVAFSYFPIRMVTIIGVTFFILGIFWTLYIVLRQIFKGDLAPGWPALVSILMICFGVSNISLGIIAEYLWRTLDATRKRPVFIVDEITDFNNNKQVDIKSLEI